MIIQLFFLAPMARIQHGIGWEVVVFVM